MLEPKHLRALYVTDTFPIADRLWPDLHMVSIAPSLAQAMQRCLIDG